MTITVQMKANMRKHTFRMTYISKIWLETNTDGDAKIKGSPCPASNRLVTLGVLTPIEPPI